MKQKHDTLIAFRVPAELARVARQIAEADDRSLSSFLKLALKHEVERAKKGQGHRHPTAA